MVGRNSNASDYSKCKQARSFSWKMEVVRLGNTAALHCWVYKEHMWTIGYRERRRGIVCQARSRQRHLGWLLIADKVDLEARAVVEINVWWETPLTRHRNVGTQVRGDKLQKQNCKNGRERAGLQSQWRSHGFLNHWGPADRRLRRGVCMVSGYSQHG
jgi:hypothetical protein